MTIYEKQTITNWMLILPNKNNEKRYLRKNGKASGPDDISAEILKASYDIISPFLVNLYNKLFINAEHPENWSLGYVIPIFKGGDPPLPKIIVASL